MQDKEKFIFSSLDETQTGRDNLKSSWKDQQDAQTGSASLHLSGKTSCKGLCLSGAVTAQRSLE